jgi:hypothetical protein
MMLRIIVDRSDHSGLMFNDREGGECKYSKASAQERYEVINEPQSTDDKWKPDSGQNNIHPEFPRRCG